MIVGCIGRGRMRRGVQVGCVGRGRVGGVEGGLCWLGVRVCWVSRGSG